MSDSMRFVDQAQMDAVNKQLEEQHRVNDTLRSLITEATEDLQKFKTLVSPESEFTFEKYKQDWSDQKSENLSIISKLDEEVKKIH